MKNKPFEPAEESEPVLKEVRNVRVFYLSVFLKESYPFNVTNTVKFMLMYVFTKYLTICKFMKFYFTGQWYTEEDLF